MSLVSTVAGVLANALLSLGVTAVQTSRALAAMANIRRELRQRHGDFLAYVAGGMAA